MGIAILSVVWVVGLVVYFTTTTERTRENVLVVIWILLLLTALIHPIRLLLSP